MERMLLITQDQHLASQLKIWLGELGGKIELKITDDFKAWSDSREKASRNANSAPAAAQSSKATPASPASVSATPTDLPSLIILDHPLMFKSTPGWVNDLKKNFTSNAELAPLFLLIIPHSSALSPESFTASGADDLIVRPLDRPVFLQKIEILMARGKPVTPSFLFRLKTGLDIEIGKDCVIEELSEVEIFIRNPMPIKAGIHATLHSSIFGTEKDSKVDVFVLDSQGIQDVDRDAKHKWRVHLRFFGLTARQLTKVRQTMKILSESQPVESASRKFVSKRPAKGTPAHAPQAHHTPLATAAALHHPLRLAILDLDPSTVRLFRVSLEPQTHDLKLLPYPTPSRMLRAWQEVSGTAHPASAQSLNSQVSTHASAKSPDPHQTPTPANVVDLEQLFEEVAVEAGEAKDTRPKPLFPSDGNLALIVKATDGAVVKIESKIEEGAPTLGFEKDDWLERDTLFASSIIPEDKELFLEMLSFAAISGQGEIELQIKGGDGLPHQISISAERAKAAHEDQAALVHLVLTEGHGTQTTEKRKNKSQVQVDALVVEASFLSSDPAGRVKFLRESYVRAGLAPNLESAPPVFVVADEKSTVTPEQFRVVGVAHFSWKIPDRRHILETFLTFASPKVWKEPDLVPRRFKGHFDAHLARESRLDELSEFGLVIQDHAPFKQGVILRFFSDILGQEEHGVLARCVSSRQTETGWNNEFIFFGSSEEFQKHIRMHVRSEYARKKSGES
jgi:hypothetical protein